MKESLNILIIDDSEDDREVYRRLLRNDEDFDWVISEAETGKEGIEKYQADEFHCVLLDYCLPSLTGLEILTVLKKHKTHAAVVMLTGQGDEAVAVESMKIGAQDYLVKDGLSSEVLRRAVHNAAERVLMIRKIEEQKEALHNFSHILAHDIKAPTRIIRTLLGDIKQSLETQDDDDIHHCFDHVIKAANSIDALVDTLSEYNNLEAKVAFDTVSMQNVMDDMLNNLGAIIEERNVQITHDVLPQIHGNAPQLSQLLQNLIGNSIKYCENETPTIHISAKQKDDAWVFTVKDNGIGINAKYGQKIFEPFKRLHNNSKYAGTGLGLATCKKILDRHGGTIWCESEEEKGSTFFFVIPNLNIAPVAGI